MTRINCIPVHELCDKHLLSEYRKLPLIFSWLEKVIEKGKEPTIPEKYCLGKGHMSFFADKLLYLNDRHQRLVDECLKRGFKIKFTQTLRYNYSHIPNKYWKWWTPDKEAQELNRERRKIINKISDFDFKKVGLEYLFMIEDVLKQVDNNE